MASSNLLQRAFRSAKFRLRRRLAAASRPTLGSAPQASNASALAGESSYLRGDLDTEMLARTAPTRLEQLYFGHKGRPMFKWVHYLPLYDRALAPYVGGAVTVVEIGVAQGGSLDLWREFFGPAARIVGVDIVPASRAFATPGTEIVIGDQGDGAFLEELARRIGEADVIIDDGSHISRHQIRTFETLFPILKQGGVYICEDLHTSYWSDWEGGLGRNDTFIAYMKRMIDRFHDRYHTGVAPAEDDLAADIAWMTVADSIAFFHKGPRHNPYMALVGSHSSQAAGS